MTRRILIADDHVPTRRDLQVFLQTQGFEVVAVGNGDLATRRAKETYPELIVLDFLMPGQTGYEACKYIRHTLQYNAPILIIYNDFEPFNRDEAIQAGADEVMAKPLDPFALLDTFTRLWRQYGRSGPDTGSFSLGDEGGENADDAFEPDIPVSENVELPPPMNSMEMEVPAELRAEAPSPESAASAEDVSTVPDYEQSLPPEYRFGQETSGPPTAEFEKELTDTLDDILFNLDELGPVVEAEAAENVPQPTTNDWFSTPPENEWRATPTGELAQDASIPPPHYVDETPPPVRAENDFSDVAAEVAAEEQALIAPTAAENNFSDVAAEIAADELAATAVAEAEVGTERAAGASAGVESASVAEELIPQVPTDPRPSRDSLADSYSVVASGHYASFFEDENGERQEQRPFSDPYPSRNMFAPLPSQPVGEVDFVVPDRITGELPAPDLSEGVSIHFDTQNASVQIEGLYEVDEVELPESVTQDLSTVTILPPADQTEMFDEADVPGDTPTGEVPVIESSPEPVMTLAEKLQPRESAAPPPPAANTTPLSGSFLAPNFDEGVGATTSAFCPHCFGAISADDVICPHCGEAV
jgi:CheY-like chemotaxis protein